MILFKFVSVIVFLCLGYLMTEAQQQYVEAAIKIKIIDPDGNPIREPKVILYDSAHQIIKEEVVVESEFNGQLKKIKIDNFGSYYLIFSKEGYKSTKEVRVTWKNDVVNRSPIVTMTPIATSTSFSWNWWIIVGVIILLVIVKGFNAFTMRKGNKSVR